MSKGEETRQFIIEKAAPIFNTRGIEATAMSDIMAATGLSKGSMYVHFNDKQVLAEAAVDHNLDRLAKRITSILSKHTTYKSKLFAYIDSFKDPIDSPIKGGCPIMNFGIDADDTNRRIVAKVKDVINASQSLIIELVENGKKKGEFKSSWNSKEFAAVLFAMLEGSIMISRVSGNIQNMQMVGKAAKNIVLQNLK
jgi:AcrR family transcriptional regulator